MAAKSVFTATLMLIAGNFVTAGEETRLIFEEDFERYTNTAAMRAAWPQGAGVLELRAPGGGQAVMHDGGEANRRETFPVLPSRTHNVVLSADLFDFGTNANRQMIVSLRNRSGARVEMGALSDESYGVRTTGPDGSVGIWTAFDKAQKPVRGWHRFQAILSLSNAVATLDLDANGKVDRTVTLTGTPPAEPWTEIRFGELPDQISPGGPMLIDNIRLELVVIPPPALVAQSATPGTKSPVAHAETTPPVSVTVGVAGSNVAGWWILGALTVIIGLLTWLVLALRRSGLRASTTLLPAVENSPPLAHEAAIAELTAFAKQSLVQGLYEQRYALLDTQRKAEQALIELEQRLASLQLPQQERICAYEDRIAELEKELETRDEEVRELTRATLLLVRRKLQEEKGLGRQRDQFN